MDTPMVNVPVEPLPTYQCHKQVKAAKINAADWVSHPQQVCLSLEVNGRPQPLFVGIDWANKHQPEKGGYVVQYADGYLSYSPAKAFEEGYTRADELADAMNEIEREALNLNLHDAEAFFAVTLHRAPDNRLVATTTIVPNKAPGMTYELRDRLQAQLRAMANTVEMIFTAPPAND